MAKRRLARPVPAALIVALLATTPAASAGTTSQEARLAEDIEGVVCWVLETILEDDSAGYLAGVHATPANHDAEEVAEWAVDTDAFLTFGTGNQHITGMPLQLAEFRFRHFHYSSFDIAPIAVLPTSSNGAYLVTFVSDGLSIGAITPNCTMGEGPEFSTVESAWEDPTIDLESLVQKASYASGSADATCIKSERWENGNHEGSAGGTVHILGLAFAATDCLVGVETDDPCSDTDPATTGNGDITATASALDFNVLRFLVTFDGDGVALCTYQEDSF